MATAIRRTRPTPESGPCIFRADLWGPELRADLRPGQSPADQSHRATAHVLAAGYRLRRLLGPASRPSRRRVARKSPKWLWIAAITAVVLVAGLVIALVIVTGSSKESAVMAPLPPLSVSSSAPSTTTTRTTPPTTSRSPSTTTSTAPTTTSATTSPTGTDNVVYTVSGEGRAINITYVDNGGVMQTEFNVMLPWSKQVTLSSPARGSASVAIVNVGRDVTCSVSINGAQVARTDRPRTHDLHRSVLSADPDMMRNTHEQQSDKPGRQNHDEPTQARAIRMEPIHKHEEQPRREEGHGAARHRVETERDPSLLSPAISQQQGARRLRRPHEQCQQSPQIQKATGPCTAIAAHTTINTDSDATMTGLPPIRSSK